MAGMVSKDFETATNDHGYGNSRNMGMNTPKHTRGPMGSMLPDISRNRYLNGQTTDRRASSGRGVPMTGKKLASHKYNRAVSDYENTLKSPRFNNNSQGMNGIFGSASPSMDLSRKDAAVALNDRLARISHLI